MAYYTGKDHSGEFDVAKIQGDSGKAYDKTTEVRARLRDLL